MTKIQIFKAAFAVVAVSGAIATKANNQVAKTHYSINALSITCATQAKPADCNLTGGAFCTAQTTGGNTQQFYQATTNGTCLVALKRNL